MTHQELKSYLQSIGKEEITVTKVEGIRDGGSVKFTTEDGDYFFMDYNNGDKFTSELRQPPYTDKDVIIDLYLAVKRANFELKEHRLNRLHNTYPYLAQINSMGV